MKEQLLTPRVGLGPCTTTLSPTNRFLLDIEKTSSNVESHRI